jgi:hypothetical protein
MSDKTVPGGNVSGGRKLAPNRHRAQVEFAGTAGEYWTAVYTRGFASFLESWAPQRRSSERGDWCVGSATHGGQNGNALPLRARVLSSQVLAKEPFRRKRS